jgi:serine protease Do
MRKIVFGIIYIITSLIFAQNSVLKQFSQAFADVAEKANPAVVTIITETEYKMEDFHQGLPFDNPFFFPRNSPRKYRGRALGSGVIVEAEKGYILTNNHVVDKADEIKIKLMDKRVISATVVGTDPKSDLAVLQIKADNLSELELGNSDKLRVGDWVLAVGSPFSANLSHTVTAGIVSALGRSNVISSRDHYEDFIQTDAAINPGNSGGALLNMEGELVGINTAIATGGFEKANRGVGFAIPSNMAKKVMQDLITKGYVVRSWLGVYIQNVDDNVAKALKLSNRDGALVSDVVEESPAEKAGLEQGDVIVEFNDVLIYDSAHLKNIVSSTPPGTLSKVIIFRDEKKKSVNVTLEEIKKSDDKTIASIPLDDREFGLEVKDVNKTLAEKYGVPMEQGVVVINVIPNSEAFDAGIQQGDLITRVGTEKIKSKREFKSQLKKAKKQGSVLLLVSRDDVSRFVALEVQE